ncbi:MAG: hypothetical protein Q9190_006319 [Brigantiaea leucoxantha]
MLLAQALVQLLYLWDIGELRTFANSFSSQIQDLVPIILSQIAVRSLETLACPQPSEVTAYAVLTLTILSTVPWLSHLNSRIVDAIRGARARIANAVREPYRPEYLWIEKTSYSSEILREAYCLAALKVSPPVHVWREPVLSLVATPSKKLAHYCRFFSQIPLFANYSAWKLEAALAEGYMYYPQLKRQRLSVFPQREMIEERYLEYIPLIWTAANYLQESPCSPSIVWNMIIISMLNFQADEYMENVVGRRFVHRLELVRQLIHHLCQIPKDGQQTSRLRFLDSHVNASNEARRLLEDSGETESLSEVFEVFSSFIAYITNHPGVESASDYDRNWLIYELRTYLLAHITQIEDNARYFPTPADRSMPHNSTRQPYFNWVSTTSADHTSCPYAFAFMACLLAPAAGSTSSANVNEAGRRDCFPGPKQKYLAQAVCRHLASMCRQYNDYGSIQRDKEEKNLNSVNFAEFRTDHGDVQGSADDRGEEDRKRELMDIAEFERIRLGVARRELEKVLGEEGREGETVKRAVRLFVDVTDVHGLIYAVRDFGIRMR